MQSFVVVGHADCGLEPLVEGLARQVPVHAHLFDRSNYSRMREMDAAGMLLKVGEDPGSFLLDRFLSGEPAGLVIRYHEVRDRLWSSVWSCVRQNFRILHVKSRRPGEIYLNGRLRVAKPPVTLDKDLLTAGLSAYLGEVRAHESLLAHADCLDLDVEEMREQGALIQEFLGLPEPLAWPERAERDLSALVTGYAEVRSLFRRVEV